MRVVRPWTTQDEGYLRENYHSVEPAVIAGVLNRTLLAVYMKACHLDLKRYPANDKRASRRPLHPPSPTTRLAPLRQPQGEGNGSRGTRDLPGPVRNSQTTIGRDGGKTG